MLADPLLEKIGKFRQWLQNNPEALVDDYDIYQKHSIENDNEIKNSGEFQEFYSVPNSPSINIQDLHDLTDMALEDYKHSMNIRFTNDLEQYNELRINAKHFLNKRCKNYARDIRNIIDTLILNEDYTIHMFKNYRELTNLCLSSEGEMSANYLRRLIGVARMSMSAMQKYFETEVVNPSVTSNTVLQESARM